MQVSVQGYDARTYDDEGYQARGSQGCSLGGGQTEYTGRAGG